MRERLLDINPDVDAAARRMFYMPERAGEIEWERYDYIVDCIDTVTAKLDLIVQAVRRGIPIISAMGAGNKLDPTAFEVADISRTSVCPLARVMRQELRKRGVEHLKVVYSREPARVPRQEESAEAPQAGGSAPIPTSPSPTSRCGRSSPSRRTSGSRRPIAPP